MKDCCASKYIAIETRMHCRNCVQPKLDKFFSMISSHDVRVGFSFSMES